RLGAIDIAAARPDVDPVWNVGIPEPAVQDPDAARPLDPARLGDLPAGRGRGKRHSQAGRRILAELPQHIKLADRHRRVAADDLIAAVEHVAEGGGLELCLGGAERAGARADPEALPHAEALRVRAAARGE